MTYRNDKLPKLKNRLSSRKLASSFREALSNVVLRLFLLSVYVKENFVTTVNCLSRPLRKKLISSLITIFKLFFWNICIKNIEVKSR